MVNSFDDAGSTRHGWMPPQVQVSKWVSQQPADDNLSVWNRCLTRLASYSESVRHTSKQGNLVSFLAQTGFTAFVNGVQLISGSPYAEAEQISQLCIADDSLSFRNICLTHFTTYT